MSRVDFSWGSGVQIREQTWAWRHEITHQIINPDIDGLMTACLLHHVKGWPVVGLYDTQRLYLDAAQPLPLDMRSCCAKQRQHRFIIIGELPSG